jgi:hypothetical protein
VRVRYYIDPATGLPHIYHHGITENEVEEILDCPAQDVRGRNNSRIAIGQTAAGRYVKVIYTVDPSPDSVFVVTAYELRPKAKRAVKRRARKK